MGYTAFPLTSEERNYRVPGKKLLPRDYFIVAEMRQSGLRSKREYAVAVAREIAAYGGHEEPSTERQYRRLSARMKREVTRVMMRDGYVACRSVMRIARKG